MMYIVWQSLGSSVYLSWARRPWRETEGGKEREGEEGRGRARIPGQWAAHLVHLREGRWHPLPAPNDSTGICVWGKETIKGAFKIVSKIKLLHSSVFHGS